MPETVILNIRGVDPEVRARLKLVAATRGITLAELLSRLVALHTATLEGDRHGCRHATGFLFDAHLEGVTA